MLNLEAIVGLKGKTVVITGAASGMAKCATELLLSLGAKVYAIDRNKVDLPVEKAIQADLSCQKGIDDAVSQLPDSIDAAYLCAGVGLRPNWEKFIQMVNFAGTRYLAESILPRVVDEGSITFISSTGGYGWKGNMKMVGEMLETKTIADAEAWIDAHLDYFKEEGAPDPYQFSKQCLSAYVKAKCRSKEYILRKIRINAIGPSFTATPLIADFNKAVSKDGSEKSGEDEMYNLFLKSWNGRAGYPEEMGYPLVILGSSMCSYVSGQVFYIDFGMTGEMDYMGAAGI